MQDDTSSHDFSSDAAHILVLGEFAKAVSVVSSVAPVVICSEEKSGGVLAFYYWYAARVFEPQLNQSTYFQALYNGLVDWS